MVRPRTMLKWTECPDPGHPRYNDTFIEPGEDADAPDIVLGDGERLFRYLGPKWCNGIENAAKHSAIMASPGHLSIVVMRRRVKDHFEVAGRIVRIVAHLPVAQLNQRKYVFVLDVREPAGGWALADIDEDEFKQAYRYCGPGWKSAYAFHRFLGVPIHRLHRAGNTINGIVTGFADP